MDKNESVGRVIAYGIGSATGLVSISSKADVNPAPEVISLLQVPFPLPLVEVTLGDITAILGAVAVLVRLRWDYADRKRRGK